MSVLNSKYARALTALLVLQSAVYYAAVLRRENTPDPRPLSAFPTTLGSWQMLQEYKIEPEVLDVLKADDTMSRLYGNPASRTTASLFIAFFKTQRSGQAPHSPKNCLPGSGWEPSATGTIDVQAGPGEPPMKINRYVVSRGHDKSVVLYWYHSHNRVIASEFAAKFWLVADAIRYNRSDTALVRVVVPVRNQDENQAVEQALAFVRDSFPDVRKQLPL